MELLKAIRGRRSVRHYVPEPLDEVVISALIDLAVEAPSAMDHQAWSFVAITDRTRLDRWSDAAKAQLIRQAAGLPERAALVAFLNTPGFNIFYDAPALVVICATDPDPMSRTDCCLAAQNLMLAAYGMGLGSCWIGFAEAWLASPEGRAELGLPEGVFPVAPLILGRPVEPAPPVPRRAPQVRWIRG